MLNSIEKYYDNWNSSIELFMCYLIIDSMNALKSFRNIVNIHNLYPARHFYSMFIYNSVHSINRIIIIIVSESQVVSSQQSTVIRTHGNV